MDKVKKFKEITNNMATLYERKNHDYGDSFGQSIQEFGVIAGIVRLSDKFNRLKSLTTKKQNQMVNEESISDTLLDLANYAIMLYMEVHKDN